jgi:putative transcriptional regulator
MAIIVNLDVMMAKRKMSLNELSDKVDLTLSNLSILKCKVLECQPGDILEFRPDK